MTDTRKDRIYATQHDTVDDFIFDRRVAEVFPDMIKRSVPGYPTVIAMTGVLAGEYIQANLKTEEVDIKVLTDKRSSELGRFAVTTLFDDLGSFKTPTLRNIAVTAPYMHDGSLKTLRDVVIHYNNGGVTVEGNPVNDFLSGGIRPLALSDEDIDALVAFMEALTSPEFAPQASKTEKK